VEQGNRTCNGRSFLGSNYSLGGLLDLGVADEVPLIQAWRDSPHLRCRDSGSKSVLPVAEYLVVRSGNFRGGIRLGVALLRQTRHPGRDCGHRTCDNLEHIRCRWDSKLRDWHVH
jgi:hypothetical protein